MSVVTNLGKTEIIINENDSIIIETKEEDGYTWNDITFKSNEEEIKIGSYYSFNYSYSREWMEYNSNYIVLLAIYNYGYKTSDFKVTRMFDIKSKKIITATQEELIECYNEEFKGITRKKKQAQNN